MTLADLIRDARNLGNCFNTWEVPLNKEVHLEVEEVEGNYVINVKVNE